MGEAFALFYEANFFVCFLNIFWGFSEDLSRYATLNDFSPNRCFLGMIIIRLLAKKTVFAKTALSRWFFLKWSFWIRTKNLQNNNE